MRERKENRRFERIRALNLIYHMAMHPNYRDKETFSENDLKEIAQEYSIPQDSFGWQLAKVTLTNLPEIDRTLLKFIETYRWDSLPPLEKSIFRLGVAQILRSEELGDIPYEVAIDETVELAKRYSYKNFYKFVNAILDKIAKEQKTRSALE